MRTWHRLSSAHVNYDKDAVVTIYSTPEGLRAGYRLPDEPMQMINEPVEEILDRAANSIGSLTHETVVIVEEELWNDKWGVLIDHPTRGTKLQTKPFIS